MKQNTTECCGCLRHAMTMQPLYMTDIGMAIPNNHTEVSRTYTPLRVLSPLHFSWSSCTGIFISQIGPPNHGHATKIATWSFVETLTLSSSRSPWWSGNARMKPASTDQLRNLMTIISISASSVNAIAHWKDKPAEFLENATLYTVANFCQSILTTEFLEDKRSEADRCQTSFCNGL